MASWSDAAGVRQAPEREVLPRVSLESVPPLELLKQQKRALIRGYARASDRAALWELLVTVMPLALLCWIGVWSIHVSWWITAGATLAISVFLIRVFCLMHECGHGSLFRTQRLNRAVGFVLGVVTGMPQYVWSQHHKYHHQTNGDWDKYRGPLTTLSVDEYEALSSFQQRLYRVTRHYALAPIAGFVYLIFNPRVNWIKGSAALLVHVLKGKLSEPHRSFRAHASTFKTRYWKTAREYRHQTANNLVLLSSWALLSWAIGPVPFFALYLTSLSLAGGAGIVMFTVQHNFDHAYASRTEEWELDSGALAGTSYLVLPRWLDWATANIGLHHIHHISASIPCYRLRQCQAEYHHLFTGVTRIPLSQIPAHLKCILWDRRAQRITSVEAYRLQKQAEEAAVPEVVGV